MPEPLQRLWEWLHTHQGKKLFRYTMVSVISTVISNVTLLIVFGVIHEWSEIPSSIFANAVATFPSYWLNRSWAWGKSGRSHFIKEVVPFWVLSAVGIAFAIVGAAVARHVGQTEHLDHLIQTCLLLLANVMAFGIFWVLKLLLFNRIFHTQSLIGEIDEHIDAEEHPERAAVR